MSRESPTDGGMLARIWSSVAGGNGSPRNLSARRGSFWMAE